MTYNLWQIFAAVAAEKADAPVVRWRGRTQTYQQLHDRSVRLANVLHGRGLGWHTARRELRPWEPGQDTVATYLLNSPEYLEVSLGGYAARAAPYNVNYRYVEDELAYLLQDASTRAIVFHGRFAERVAEVVPSLEPVPLLIQVADDSGADLLPGALDYEEALASVPPALSVAGHDPDDLYLLYTGGTTGMPKGTLWRQADIWVAALGGDFFPEASLDDIATAATASSKPHFLPNAPFMHAAAHWTALRTLFGGGTVVINSVVDRLDPPDVWSLVGSEQVDMTMMVGEAFARPLLDELEAGDYDTSSLTLVILGGAATSPDTKRRLLEALPSVLVVDGAGSTETGGALTATSTSEGVSEAAVFRPSAGTVVLDAALSGPVVPGHEEPGWFAKSGHIPLGYLGDEAKTRETFPEIDGVRYSVPGDRARLRTDGSIELLGREAATINSGGEKIFGEEVEAAMLTHPSVVDAVVVGRDSDRWGQEVVAVVSVRDDVSDGELLAAVSSRLGRFKVPKAIVRVDEVFRSPSGKADYRWAREVAAGGRASGRT